MLSLFYIIIFIELLTIFYNLIKFLIYKLKFKTQLKSLNSNCDNFHIYVLIPCYKEISVIKETLDHFKKITNGIKNIDIYIITTEKERNENTLGQTTYDYLLNLDILNNPQFHLLNYPQITGMMADQLNYAIEEILKNHFPKIIQQYSNYFLNYNFQNFIMKGFSIYQTAFEFRNGIINNSISKYLYSHVVGHGLTIRADYIQNLNGFNSNFWCEDIYLTGLLHNNNEKILYLNSLDNAQNPENLKVQIIQNAVWFKTASHHFSILKNISKNFNISLNGFIWLCHEFRATFIWLMMPVFLLYSLIYPLVNKYYSLLLLIGTYLIFVFTNYLLNLIIINKKRFIKYMKNYFSCCLAILLTSIGPFYSLFLKNKIKTKR